MKCSNKYSLCPSFLLTPLSYISLRLRLMLSSCPPSVHSPVTILTLLHGAPSPFSIAQHHSPFSFILAREAHTTYTHLELWLDFHICCMCVVPVHVCSWCVSYNRWLRFFFLYTYFPEALPFSECKHEKGNWFSFFTSTLKVKYTTWCLFLHVPDKLIDALILEFSFLFGDRTFDNAWMNMQFSLLGFFPNPS